MAIPTNAFQGDYYQGKSFNTFIKSRTDAQINFLWDKAAPISGVTADNFSVRWQGNWNFSVAGTYKFTARTDDGMRVWVDDALVIDGWKVQAPTTYTGSVVLSAGAHLVKVEYFEQSGGASAQLSWALTGTTVTLPAAPSNLLASLSGDILVAPSNLMAALV